MATPEKALCDQLRKLPPASNNADLETLLFGHLRVYEDELSCFQLSEAELIAESYRCGNVSLFAKRLRRTR